MAKTHIHPRASAGARRLLVILTAACLAAPFIPVARATGQKTSLVFMNLTRRDFGDVFAGEELEQVFPVRNDGDAPLEMAQKPLTGWAVPESSNVPLRASAFYAGSRTALTARPAALSRAAPS
jgi:hypothetical protein